MSYKEEHGGLRKLLTREKSLEFFFLNKKPTKTSNDFFKILLFIFTGQIYLYVAQMFTIASCTFIHRNGCHSGKWQ